MIVTDYERVKAEWLVIEDVGKLRLRYVKEGPAPTDLTVYVEVQPRDGTPHLLLCRDEDGVALIEKDGYPERIGVGFPEESIARGMFTCYSDRHVAYRKSS